MSRKTNIDPKLQEILDSIGREETGGTDHGNVCESAESAVERRDQLKTLYQRFVNDKEKDFTPGQLVVWKPGLKNKRFPRYGEPVIVVEQIVPPILDHSDNPGSPYYREALDIVLCILDSDGDLLCYHYDSRRFQAYQE